MSAPRVSDVIDAALYLGDNRTDQILHGRALSDATVEEMRHIIREAREQGWNG